MPTYQLTDPLMYIVQVADHVTRIYFHNVTKCTEEIQIAVSGTSITKLFIPSGFSCFCLWGSYATRKHIVAINHVFKTKLYTSHKNQTLKMQKTVKNKFECSLFIQLGKQNKPPSLLQLSLQTIRFLCHKKNNLQLLFANNLPPVLSNLLLSDYTHAKSDDIAYPDRCVRFCCSFSKNPLHCCSIFHPCNPSYKSTPCNYNFYPCLPPDTSACYITQWQNHIPVSLFLCPFPTPNLS